MYPMHIISHSAIKLKIVDKTDYKNCINIWKLTNILNNQWVTDENKEKIRQLIQLKNNTSATFLTNGT